MQLAFKMECEKKTPGVCNFSILFSTNQPRIDEAHYRLRKDDTKFAPHLKSLLTIVHYDREVTGIKSKSVPSLECTISAWWLKHMLLLCYDKWM